MFRISNVALAMALMAGVSTTAAFTQSSSSAAFGVTVNRNHGPAAAAAAVSINNLNQIRTSSPTAIFMAEAESSDPKPSTLVRKPESNIELTITAPGAATKAAYDQACAEVSKTVNIPGFRKGAKIPPAVLENAVAAKGGKMTLRTQAIQSLLNQLLEPALREEHNLEPIGQPGLVTPADVLAESFKPGEPIEMVVSCDVWPDIKWKDVEGQEKPYFGLEGTYNRPPFNQARYDQALKDLADRYATTEDAEEGRELVMGDACVVDMQGFMAAEDGTSKAEPLPNAASGDDVEVILGDGRYMEGLVEGLMGAKVGETKTIYVTFPVGLRDKTLAGKKAVFDVTVKEASVRTVPEIDDELAEKIRPGLDADGVRSEIRKAVDEQDSEEWVDSRNKALAKALAGVMDVEVPDTLVTNQAREKYAQMMAEFRTQGMEDEEIKKLITPENFLKYKDIQKPDIVDDFKTSMAVDEIARLEGIEVPAYKVDEQLDAIKQEAQGEDLGDETVLRNKIESTVMRRMVNDFLATESKLEVQYDEENFDEKLMEQLAQESLEREEQAAEGDSVEAEGETIATEEDESEPAVAEAEAEVKVEESPKAEESVEPASPQVEDDVELTLEEKAFKSLVSLGMVEVTPDPDSPDYDHSNDDDEAAENIYSK